MTHAPALASALTQFGMAGIMGCMWLPEPRAAPPAACAAPGAHAPSPGPGEPPRPAQALAQSPFAPASLRIFPLTRMDRDSGGHGIILFHFELRDRWGDGVKWPGNLQVQL